MAIQISFFSYNFFKGVVNPPCFIALSEGIIFSLRQIDQKGESLNAKKHS